MKNILLMLLAVFPIMTAEGQQHLIDVQGGINFSNITAVDLFEDREMRIGFAGGISYGYGISSRLRMGIGLFYSQQGFRNEIRFTDVFGNETGESENVEFNYDYLSIPMKIGYIAGNRVKIIPAIGIRPSFLLSAETIFPEIDIDGFYHEQETTNTTELVSTFDFGGFLELGAEFRLSDKLLFGPVISYGRSFTNFSNAGYFDGSAMKHCGFSAAMVIKYGIK